jgi:hypothetical protein
MFNYSAPLHDLVGVVMMPEYVFSIIVRTVMSSRITRTLLGLCD